MCSAALRKQFSDPAEFVLAVRPLRSLLRFLILVHLQVGEDNWLYQPWADGASSARAIARSTAADSASSVDAQGRSAAATAQQVRFCFVVLCDCCACDASIAYVYGWWLFSWRGVLPLSVLSSSSVVTMPFLC